MKKTKLLIIFLILFSVINIVLYATKAGGDKYQVYIADLLPVITSFIAVICLYKTYISFKDLDKAKIAWFLFFSGITFNFLAETTYSTLELVFKVNVEEVFPTFADYLWCTAYFPLIGGVLLMFFGFRSSGFPMGKKYIYFILVPLLVFLIWTVYNYLLLPIITDGETPNNQKFFYLFYPIADLVLVAGASVLVYITSLFGHAALAKPWRYLAFGFICITLADIIYSYLSWQGLYGSGNPIDIAWNSGYLLIGLAGLYQTEVIESIS